MKNLSGFKFLLWGNTYTLKKRFAYFPTIVQSLENKAFYLIWLMPYFEDKKKDFLLKYKYIQN